MAIALMLGLSACFAPSLPSTIECSEFGECPPDHVCRSGFCVIPGPNADAAVPDGRSGESDARADAGPQLDCAKVENLKDDFDGMLSDVWDRTQENGGTIAARNGVLSVDFGLIFSNAFVASVQRWDLEGSEVSIEAVDAIGAASSSYLGLFDQFPNQSLYFGMTVEMGLLKLEVTDAAAGIPAFSELEVLTFNQQLHRFWRLRHDGDTVYYELSSNGINWEVFGTFAPSVAPNGLIVSLGANGSGLDGIAFDDLNGGGSPMPHDCNN